MAVDTSKLVEKAREAVQRRNYAYAMDLYQQALALDQDNGEIRRELRASATRYVQETGASKTGALLQGLGSLGKILVMGLSKSSDSAERLMTECERFLARDPTNLWVLTKLGQTAMRLKYLNAAVAVFEDARQSRPAHIKTLLNLKEAYKARGDVPAAIKVCEEVLRLNPHDPDASVDIRNLSAIKSTETFAQGAREGATTIVKDDKTHERFEVESHEIRSAAQRDRLIAFHQEKLAQSAGTDPRHVAVLHAKIGDLWLAVDPEFDRAEAAYNQARTLQPTDFTYVFKLDDLKVRRYDARLKELEAAMKASPSDAAVKADYQKLKAERDEFRMKSFEQRAKVRPMDMLIAYTLGTIYFGMNKLDEAIAQFQRTVGDPARRSDSLNSLGVCFTRKSQYELAVKQYRQALGELEVMNDRKKVILYNLGDTLVRMGDRQEAAKAFTQLYEADISFRDVTKRLDQLRAAGG